MDLDYDIIIASFQADKATFKSSLELYLNLFSPLSNEDEENTLIEIQNLLNKL